jgi:hypothetical protein
MINEILEETTTHYLRGNIHPPNSPIPQMFFYIGLVGIYLIASFKGKKQVLPLHRQHLR